MNIGHNPMDSIEMSILLNLRQEYSAYTSNNGNCKIKQYFSSHGISSPVDSDSTFMKGMTFIGRENNTMYSGPAVLIYSSLKPFSKAYIGGIQNGKRHGFGYRMLAGKIYAGYYINDKKCGAAKMYDIHNRELIFDGTFNNGKMQGECYLKDHDHKFQGNIKDDIYHGSCSIKYSNGDVFKGNMNHGQMDGQGSINYKNGDRFNGIFKNISYELSRTTN